MKEVKALMSKLVVLPVWRLADCSCSTPGPLPNSQELARIGTSCCLMTSSGYSNSSALDLVIIACIKVGIKDLQSAFDQGPEFLHRRYFELGEER